MADSQIGIQNKLNIEDINYLYNSNFEQINSSMDKYYYVGPHPSVSRGLWYSIIYL